VAQSAAVESVCADPDVHVWIASEGSRTTGFVALKLHPEDRMGEICMIASFFTSRLLSRGLLLRSLHHQHR
jgi:hypothetical protein